MADVKLDVRINVDADQNAIRAVQKEINGIEKALGSLEKTGDSLGGSLGRITEIFTGAFAANIATAALGSLISSVQSFGKAIISDGVASAQEFEAALNNFNIALASNGEFTKQASAEFVAFADAVEKSTGIADDSILRTGALLANITGATGESLKGATQATIDFASALQIDLESASRILGRAVEGNVEGLKRYGIEVEKGKTSTENLANVVEAISARFGGTAAQQINTFAGAVRLNSNAFDDFTKAIGQTITQNQTIIGVIKAVAVEFGRLEEFIKANQQEIRTFISEGVIFAINGLLGLINVLDVLGRAFQLVQNSISVAVQGIVLAINTTAELILTALNKVVSFLPGFSGAFDQAVADLKATNSSLRASIAEDYQDIQQSISGTSTAFDVLEPALQRIKLAAEEGFGAVRDGASTSIEPINQNKAAVDSLNASLERQKQIEEEKKKLIQEGEQVFQRVQNQDPNAKYEAELAALDAYHTAKLERERGHQEQIDAINAEFDAARAVLQEEKDVALQEKKAKEIEDLIARNEVLRGLDEQKNAQEIASNDAKIKKILEGEELSAKKRDEIKLKEKKREEALLRERLTLASEFFQNLSALQEFGSRTLFNIGKRAAQASAVVEGALAVQKALSAAPPPFNYALAAAVAVRTAANIQKINAQQFATGTDFVRGPGGIDNVPALLTRGERVISREGNEDLTQFLQDQGPQNEILLEISSKLDRLSPNVTVEIGGKEIANVVREQVRAGRVIA